MANSIAYAGYIIALIGAIIIILYGILGLIGSAFLIFSPLSFLGGVVSGIIKLIIGLVCLAGSRYVSNVVWAIVLIILGIVAGDIGGTLVIIGALLGLASRLVRTTA